MHSPLIFKNYGTEQIPTVFTSLYLRKSSHSVKVSKQDEKWGWKFYPPLELVHIFLNKLSTFQTNHTSNNLIAKNFRGCCKFFYICDSPLEYICYDLSNLYISWWYNNSVWRCGRRNSWNYQCRLSILIPEMSIKSEKSDRVQYIKLYQKRFERSV